ncbi:hypothetical protein BV898_02103 [Hypsibius exemplaris]|uniref:Uncharacterized protein n=1 Tax=Hypsibius exemplaris TaxID=2072580 RepID=A0A1W0X9I2_HYPEX|nr:hypothetical protein BV898_02103 [Hypsibius exemplaris]
MANCNILSDILYICASEQIAGTCRWLTNSPSTYHCSPVPPRIFFGGFALTAERLNPLLRHATWRINFGFIAPVCWPKESGDAVVEIRCSTPSSNYAEARQLVCVGTYMPGTWHKDCSFYAFRNSSQSERDVIYVTNCKQGLLISHASGHRSHSNLKIAPPPPRLFNPSALSVSSSSSGSCWTLKTVNT